MKNVTKDRETVDQLLYASRSGVELSAEMSHRKGLRLEVRNPPTPFAIAAAVREHHNVFCDLPDPERLGHLHNACHRQPRAHSGIGAAIHGFGVMCQLDAVFLGSPFQDYRGVSP